MMPEANIMNSTRNVNGCDTTTMYDNAIQSKTIHVNLNNCCRFIRYLY